MSSLLACALERCLLQGSSWVHESWHVPSMCDRRVCVRLDLACHVQ